jgi:hypothetical protein
VELFIADGQIVVRFEIGEQDYQWFSDVIPQEVFEGGYFDGDRDVRFGHFMQKQFVLMTNGRRMTGRVKKIDHRNRIARAGLSSDQVDSTLFSKKVVYVEIEYALLQKPAEIIIAPPLPSASDGTPANIGFVVYHKTVPVNDLRFLEKKELLHLDWEDPWYSYFENRNISRHHQSSFMSFLYIEPYEVRHEVLGRIKDLEGWIDLGYELDDVITVEEQDSLRQIVADFLAARNSVTIDGKEQKPVIDRVHFVEANLAGIQILEVPKPMPYVSALIGVIFAYPHEGVPDSVTIRWDLFNDKIQSVPATSIGPEGPWPYDLKPSDNELKWTNFLTHYQLPNVTEQKVEPLRVQMPIFSVIFVLMIIFVIYRNGWRLNRLSRWRKFFFVLYILLAIIAFPVGWKVEVPFLEDRVYSVPEAKELISQLLKNTYRAFDFRDEGVIYDKLAICNDKDLLQKIYLQTRKSMVIENQGGIEARVDEVFVAKVEEVSSEADGPAYKCSWIVKGEVGHWGHKHRRINQYEAIISLRPVDGLWKMHDVDIIEEKRL